LLALTHRRSGATSLVWSGLTSRGNLLALTRHRSDGSSLSSGLGGGVGRSTHEGESRCQEPDAPSLRSRGPARGLPGSIATDHPAEEGTGGETFIPPSPPAATVSKLLASISAYRGDAHLHLPHRGAKVFIALLTSFGHVSTLSLQGGPRRSGDGGGARARGPHSCDAWWCAFSGRASILREPPHFLF